MAMARILVIDDELVIRQALAIMLANVGHKVETAENGRAGLELLERESFDLVLTDILMPEMDGVEAMRKLRALPSPPKIVAMSGGVQLSREDFPRAAELLGADAALSKPFRARELYALVERLLGPASGRGGT
jgi:CheY-like chemotaxis protein